MFEDCLGRIFVAELVNIQIVEVCILARSICMIRNGADSIKLVSYYF